jgi:glucokinase
MEKRFATVLSLDAGGTNFVFSAYSNNKKLVENISFPANGDNLDKCIETIISGFKLVKEKTGNKANAISFAFPGPADFKQGIIGDLYNLPGFRGGVPLAAILEREFKIPVYINNDGDLYAYGEALAGTLPDINTELKKCGNPKEYKNLCGLTLGTGFGGGVVSNKKLLLGDSICAAEVWTMSNRMDNEINNEEGISIRAVKRFYSEFADISFNYVPEPKQIYEIAKGKLQGDSKAAEKAFSKMGNFLGDAIANLITITDGIIVIGGGISGAKDIIAPGIMEQVSHRFKKLTGGYIPRLTHQVYYLNDELQMAEFLKNESVEILVPGSDQKLYFNPKPKTGFVFSKYNTSDMINLGAYHFAVENL